MRSILRQFLFWLSLPWGGEFRATEGTWKFRFLAWLYGDGEPEFAVFDPGDEDGA